jgi:hypothetical protein
MLKNHQLSFRREKSGLSMLGKRANEKLRGLQGVWGDIHCHKRGFPLRLRSLSIGQPRKPPKPRLALHIVAVILYVGLTVSGISIAAQELPQGDSIPRGAIEPASDIFSSDEYRASNEVIRLPPVESPPPTTPDAAFGPKTGNAGGEGMGLGMGMGPGSGTQGPLRYKTLWFPSVSVEGQPGNWGMVGQDFGFAFPLWTASPAMLLLSGGVNNRLISTDILLPDSHKAYPDNLWDARLGLMYIRRLSAGQTLMCGVNVGSASDRPFASLQEMNASVMAMYRRPSGERNAWTFGVMYSPTSELQFPIPMVSYNWNPSDQFQANLGLPFSLRYRPDDRWTFEASYMPIHTINAKGSYRWNDWLKIVGGYSWSNENYMMYDRVDCNERFFLYDQRLSLGLESSFCSWATLELTGGYAFNRYSYFGQQWDSSQRDRVNIADGPFLMLGASLRR